MDYGCGITSAYSEVPWLGHLSFPPSTMPSTPPVLLLPNFANYGVSGVRYREVVGEYGVVEGICCCFTPTDHTAIGTLAVERHELLFHSATKAISLLLFGFTRHHTGCASHLLDGLSNTCDVSVP